MSDLQPKRKRLVKISDLDASKKSKKTPPKERSIASFFSPPKGGVKKNAASGGIASFFAPKVSAKKQEEVSEQENRNSSNSTEKAVTTTTNEKMVDDTKEVQPEQQPEPKVVEEEPEAKLVEEDKEETVVSEGPEAKSRDEQNQGNDTHTNANESDTKSNASDAEHYEDDNAAEDEDDEEEEDDIDSDEATDQKQEKKKKKATKKDSESECMEDFSGEFDPVKSASWKPGKDVPFLALAQMFEKVEATSKRLVIIKHVANLFRSVIATTPSQLLPCVYLCTGSVAPAYEGQEMGIGDQILLKAISQSTGTNMPQLKAKLKEIGDLGIVAEQSRSNQKTMFPPPPLYVAKVFKQMKELAQLKGNKVGEKKCGTIKQLLVSCKGPEARYVVRMLQGSMRIGLAEKSILAALGQAVSWTPPSLDGTIPPPILNNKKTMKSSKFEALIEANTDQIKQAYTEVPSYNLVIEALLKYGASELATKCFLTPGTPIKVMLGKPAKGIQEVLKKFANQLFTIEFKYDGERGQIHLCPDGTIKIYSRNSEDNTSKYPDLIKLLPSVCDQTVTSAILDCEVVAWCPKENKILPFQTLTTRKRKDAKESEIQVQVCLFAFDLIYLNGKSFLNVPFAHRRKALHDHFKVIDGKFQYADYKDTSDMEEIQEYMNLAMKSSCEGLMVKSLEVDAGYVPNERNWLKVKKDYLDGVGDTLDLVPIAAFYGKGKRTGLYGAFLLACYDEETEEYQAICKIGTGFSDENLQEFTKFLKGHVLEEGPRSYYNYPDTLKPDAWFDTVQTWEVLCADLSISPIYPAANGLVDEVKGIALRFPRFVRIRPDKSPEEATTAEQVADMYRNQSVISG